MSIVSAFPIFFIELAVLISVVLMTSRQFIKNHADKGNKLVDMDETIMEKKESVI